MSFWTSFKKHAEDVVHVILRTGDVLQKYEPMIETAEAIVFPPAVAVTHAAAGAFALVTNAVRDARQIPGAVQTGNSKLLIEITQEEYAYYEQFVDFIHGHAQSNGIPLLPSPIVAAPPKPAVVFGADPAAQSAG